MPGALARSERESLVGPPAWARSTVHDFFRKANWDNRPIEPPRAQKISPYELSVRQFFHGVDWQWAPGVGSAGASLSERATTLSGFDALGPESLGPDDLGSGDLDLNGTALNGAAIDQGLTLDGFTDLF
jgi:hypothetical protein